MKRFCGMVLILVVCLAWLPAWAGETGDQEGGWRAAFDGEALAFWERIDGSTATIPLTEAMAMHRLGITQAQASELLHHNTTALAYDGITYEANDETQLIFVTAPSPYELERAKEREVELEFVPVTHDALVFLNNRRNPVTALTQAQLKDMYTGKITSWKEVGGEDVAIIPFQRPRGSGSQTLFEMLLMKEVKPMDPPVAYRPTSMGQLVNEVSSYENGQSSLGYSVYYYVTDMYGNDQMRLLAVDGVTPEPKTIIDHSYPMFTYYYAVLPKDTPADSPYRELVAWLLTDEGQRVAQSAGYIPLREVAVAP